jgi:hypothetical protein
MEGTHLSLNVSFHAMYLILSSSKGISALNLSQQRGCNIGPSGSSATGAGSCSKAAIRRRWLA